MSTVNDPLTAGLTATAGNDATNERAARETAGRKTADKVWEYGVGGIQGLARHVPSGTYYGRIHVPGRGMVRQSLGTRKFSLAKEQLPHFVIRVRGLPVIPSPDDRPPKGVRWEVAAAEYLLRSRQDPTLSPRTVEYRTLCVQGLERTWPGLRSQKAHQISPGDVRKWAARVSATVSPNYYNQMIATGRAIWAILEEANGGIPADCPFNVVKRLGVKPPELVLPSSGQWKAFVAWLDGHPSGAGAATLVRLLAYAGLRISEAEALTWGDLDWARGMIRVESAKGRASSNHSDVRWVPMVADFRAFFEPRSSGKPPGDRIAEVTDIRFWFQKATKTLDFPRLSNHDLRHLYATKCIESGVDIPTVSRWLGHKDGGALAMRVYGHLRVEHSVEAARKVSFS